VTFAFGGIALAAVVLVIVVVPRLTDRYLSRREAVPADSSRLRATVQSGIEALGQGVRDALSLLRRRQFGVLTGSFGYMAFDIAVLGVCYRAFGHSPSVGVLVVAYIIGLLGGIIPIPGGIGGTEGGLIGMLALYHAPLATTAVAVLAYRVIQLWVPALLGFLAFIQLRRELRQDEAPAAMCAPLAEPLEVVRLPLAG
jgi:uncharacterized protein (TIRG00374 family)